MPSRQRASEWWSEAPHLPPRVSGGWLSNHEGSGTVRLTFKSLLFNILEDLTKLPFSWMLITCFHVLLESFLAKYTVHFYVVSRALVKIRDRTDHEHIREETASVILTLINSHVGPAARRNLHRINLNIWSSTPLLCHLRSPMELQGPLFTTATH